jgi:hypothetical protein
MSTTYSNAACHAQRNPPELTAAPWSIHHVGRLAGKEAGAEGTPTETVCHEKRIEV